MTIVTSASFVKNALSTRCSDSGRPPIFNKLGLYFFGMDTSAQKKDYRLRYPRLKFSWECWKDVNRIAKGVLKSSTTSDYQRGILAFVWLPLFVQKSLKVILYANGPCRQCRQGPLCYSYIYFLSKLLFPMPTGLVPLSFCCSAYGYHWNVYFHRD